MKKLILSGAAFAALMMGPVSAADMVARPVYRSPQTVYVNPFPSWQRGPFEWSAPRTNRCRDGSARYRGQCVSGRRSARGSARSSAASARSRNPQPAATRAVRGAQTVNAPAVETCVEESKKQYWATSLSRAVNRGFLQGLQDAVARGEVGWLDVDAEFPVSNTTPGTNLILYQVGGNCYTGRDCDRFPSSKPTGDRWGGNEREIDLTDPQTRKIVVTDMIKLVQRADERAPAGATVGVHLDNVQKLDAGRLALLFNEYMAAVEAAKEQGLISKARTVGYVAKNNPEGFKRALDLKLLKTVPLYQINENATLNQDGSLDESSRAAQDLGRRYNIPVFLKTFGTDVAYSIDRDGKSVDIQVTQDMTRRMAEMPNISGAAWSSDEAHYQPTLFAQGAAVRTGPKVCHKVSAIQGVVAPATQ
jgi:hypothetical protein